MSAIDPAPAERELVSYEELALAARNHGMPLEGLRYDVTPVGMHYLLIHFDIPAADAETWTIDVGGLVERPLTLSVDGPPCASRRHDAGHDGMRRQRPRAPATRARVSQPWLDEAVGNGARGRARRSRPILDEAGLEPDGDRGRVPRCRSRHAGRASSRTTSGACRSPMRCATSVLLAYELNGQPLPPQHGFPVRLLVPGWYGMTSVKWLRSITAVAEPFDGYQMWAYRLRQHEEDEGTPVTRIVPRALMIPPGFPEFFTRSRTLDAGPVTLEGRAWSGWGSVIRVEVSVDGGASWADAQLSDPVGPYAWRHWTSRRGTRSPASTSCVVRATDDAGNVQPTEQPWNHHGLSNNLVQRIAVVVR